MDNREQESLPFLWFFPSLLEEGHKTIISWRKNFTKLTLMVILPALSFIFLLEIRLLSSSYPTIVKSMVANITKPHAYDQRNFASIKRIFLSHHQTSHLCSYDQCIFLGLFKSLRLIPFLVLSPIPIAAAVYYAAIIISNSKREVVISKEEIIDVTFKVWKRLLAFSYQGYVAILSFMTLVAVVMTCLAQVLAALSFVSFLETIYFMGLVYLCVIWQMTTILNVLDEAYSNNNISKIKPLKNWEIIEGKMWAKAVVLFSLTFLRALTRMVFQQRTLDVAGWVMYWIYCLLVLSVLSLFALVVQMMMHYVCEMYRLEDFQWYWCSLLGDDQVAACQEENGSVKVMDVHTEQLDV